MGTTLEFEYTPEFQKAAKVLSKRYLSLANDLKALCDEIISNPHLGDDLGNGIRKISIGDKIKR